MSDDILARIDEVMARNAERFHPFGPVRPPVSRPLALPYRCRGCRLWIAQDVKLCGPCSALPSCSAERSAAEWGGLAVCFRPDGHDGQHESVQGRCWMDPVCGALPAFVLPPGIGSCRLPAGHPSWRQHMDERGTSFRDTATPPREPFLMAAVDAERDAFAARLADAMTAMVPQPEIVVLDRRRSLECTEAGLEHGDCSGDAADRLSACLCDCHILKRPWWKRLLP